MMARSSTPRRRTHKLVLDVAPYDPEGLTECGKRRKHLSCYVRWLGVTCPECLARKPAGIE
jgi:hypothetical protein